MKTHTSDLKNNIKEHGRELDSKITYELNGDTVELGNEELNSITPHYKSALLKSTMRQLDIDSNVEIPEGTIVNYQLGVKVGNSYEYLNYGNYIVYSIEKQEDTRSYLIKCYDKMLYSMKDYEDMELTYPLTVRDFIIAICNKLGLTFKNANEQFVNSGKMIPKELYLSTEGRSLGYTFRDVLDELAEVTASNICINETDDELEIRYIKDAGTETEATGSSIEITQGEEAELSSFELEGKTTQATRSGKNLFNGSGSTSANGITFTKNEDGSYNITGTSTAQANAYNYVDLENSGLENGQTYTFSSNQALPSGVYVMVELYNGTTWLRHMISALSSSTQKDTSTSNLTNATRVRFGLRIDSGKTINISNLKIQLELGSTATDYEQYGVQPSPEFPSDLISVGYKNIVSSSLEQNAWSNSNGTGTIWSNQYIRTQDFIKVDKSTTYRLSYIYSNKYGNILSYDSNKNFINSIDIPSSLIFTTSNNTAYIKLNFYNSNGISPDDISNLQITKGNQLHSYIPYSKYGVEIKTAGKNLFDSKLAIASIGGVSINYNEEEGTLTFDGTATSNATAYAFINYPIDMPFIIKANTKYTASVTKISGSVTFGENTEHSSIQMWQPWNYGFQLFFNNITNGRTSSTKTPTADVNLSRIQIAIRQNDVFNNFKIGVQFEKGEYSSFKKHEGKKYQYILDEPLRSIENTKDLLYIKNGFLYVERKIGKFILNGSEDWNNDAGTVGTNYRHNIQINRLGISADDASIKRATHFKWSRTNNGVWGEFYLSSSWLVMLDKKQVHTLETFKTWLSTHKPEINYILETAYTEELGQVEAPGTYEGITYIETTNDNEPTMNISYISGFEEIDEEYLKDVNVNFGEKFGPVNTIILSRSGGSDKLAQSIPSDIADEDKIAIEISENQIMNDNDRADYMPEILNKLNGIEYYLNDFTSTGICYLNLLDRYRIKVFENTYKCLMLNDEANITQGLEESIYTEKPEETETEYKYTSSDDRKINQTYIIAKKNEGTIEAVVEAVSGEEGLTQRVERVETKQTSTDFRINAISKNVTYTDFDEEGNPTDSKINQVETTTGFTFNAEGMTIEDSSSNFKALHRNTGTYYKDGNTIVGQYTKDGSKQKDLELFGVYYYGKNDLPDTPMFVAQLFTDGNGEECFGHFYNRGD